MERYLRRGQPVLGVRSPDQTRVFFGLHPNGLGTHGEAPYIAALARQVDGAAEVTLPAGRADVANDTTVFEVEPVRSWRKGAQQAFAYSAMSGLRPALAVFGEFRDLLPTFLKVRDRMAPLELWVWSHGRWEKITSRAAATRKVHFVPAASRTPSA